MSKAPQSLTPVTLDVWMYPKCIRADIIHSLILSAALFDGPEATWPNVLHIMRLRAAERGLDIVKIVRRGNGRVEVAERRGGKWRIVQSYEVSIPARPSSPRIPGKHGAALEKILAGQRIDNGTDLLPEVLDAIAAGLAKDIDPTWSQSDDWGKHPTVQLTDAALSLIPPQQVPE